MLAYHMFAYDYMRIMMWTCVCVRVYIVRMCVSPPPVQPSPAEETSTQREWEPGTPAFHAVKRSGGRREEGGGRREEGGGNR